MSVINWSPTAHVVQVLSGGGVAVTTADVKEHLQIESSFTSDDALIDTLTQAATLAIEDRLRRYLVDTNIRVYWDHPPGAIFLLPGGKCSALTQIQYRRELDDVIDTVASSVYHVDLDDDLAGRVDLADSQSWPNVSTRPNSFYVDCTCGYGAATDIPEPIVVAVKMLVNDLYTHRGATAPAQYIKSNPIYDQLLGRYVVPTLP